MQSNNYKNTKYYTFYLKFKTKKSLEENLIQNLYEKYLIPFLENSIHEDILQKETKIKKQ